MYKKYLFIITLLMFIPLCAFAKGYPKVLTLDAGSKDATINFEGTTEDTSHAVMCKLYLDNKEVDKISLQVDNNKFSGSFENVELGKYAVACANYEGGEIKKIVVTLSSDKVEEKEYVVEDDGNGLSFKKEDGHNYTLSFQNLTSLTDEELKSMNVTKEEYNTTLVSITEKTKEYGNLLALYSIIVTDENAEEVHSGPFSVKIKLTEEMKKYNTFKLIYIDDEMNAKTVVELKIEGEYLVGELPHLSNYALLGSITKENTNPKTADNIFIWGGLLTISSLGIYLGINSLNKKKIK